MGHYIGHLSSIAPDQLCCTCLCSGDPIGNLLDLIHCGEKHTKILSWSMALAFDGHIAHCFSCTGLHSTSCEASSSKVFSSLFGTMSDGEQDSQQEGGPIDLSGLAAEWESMREVRALLVQTGSVLVSEPNKYHPSDTVPGVAVNRIVLAPIMRRLWVGTGNGYGVISMISIPAVENELLVSY